ncbi:hypothetical protein HW537_11025 [Asaia siamensis]
MTCRVRLYRPADLFGRAICWRLESDYSHATIEFDGTIYSATVPKVVSVGLADTAFGMPPRSGRVFDVGLTDSEAAKALAYCRSMVGTSYDLLSVAGWALRIQSMQRLNRPYCFELVYDALAVAGVFSISKRLVTGDQLLADLYATGRVQNVALGPLGVGARSRLQKNPIIIPAPKVKT